MNLYEQLEQTPCLRPCENVKAAEFIKLLGLRRSDQRKGKPCFLSDTVNDFYSNTQLIIDNEAPSYSRRKYLKEIRNTHSSLFEYEAIELLATFGHEIYGQDRSHVIDATMDEYGRPSEPLYPSDLFFSNPRDYSRILLYVRCWIANRALRKASNMKSKPESPPPQSKETSTFSDRSHHIGLEDEDMIQGDETMNGNTYRASTTLTPESQDLVSRCQCTATWDFTRKRSREEFEIGECRGVPDIEENTLETTTEVRNMVQETTRSDDCAELEGQVRPSKLVRLRIDGGRLRRLENYVLFQGSNLGSRTWTDTSASNLTTNANVVDAPFLLAPHPSEAMGSIQAQNTVNNDIETLKNVSLDTGVAPEAVSIDKEHISELDSPTRCQSPLPRIQSIATTHRELSQESIVDSNATSIENDDLKVSVEILLLRRQIFDTLLSILRNANLSSAVILDLEPMVKGLINHVKMVHINEHEEQESSMTDTVFGWWVQMHMQLEVFRSATNYTGRLGKEWDDHCSSLRSWDETSLALGALNKLNMWKLSAGQDGLPATGRDFDYELATFFEDLIQIPELLPGKLFEGVSLYNKELATWFTD